MEFEESFSSSAAAVSSFTCNVVKFVTFSTVAYTSVSMTTLTVVGELANGRYRR